MDADTDQRTFNRFELPYQLSKLGIHQWLRHISVVATSGLASTLMRRCINVICPLGIDLRYRYTYDEQIYATLAFSLVLLTTIAILTLTAKLMWYLLLRNNNCITGSNLITHGQLLCKEMSHANIRTWVAQVKKVAFSGGLSTIWGFCRLGGRYFKNRRMLYCAELNSIQPSTKIYVKI